jgi:Protein of unknown function (DUF3047)
MGVAILGAGGAGVVLLSPKSPASTVAVARTSLADSVRPGASDAANRIRIAIAEPVPARLPAEGVPRGWQLKQFAGEAAVEVVRTDGRVAMRLRSDRASFAVHRDVVVDLKTFPYLTWAWKVTQLPAGGDVRDSTRDDQAAQLYVVFPRWPSPRTTSDVIGYVWDSRAPSGTQLTHPKASNVRIVVVESGRTALDRWQRYQRNVADDYVALFGKPAPRVGKVALMVDSNDTRAQAEAFVGDLFFSKTSGGRAEIPTIVLR